MVLTRRAFMRLAGGAALALGLGACSTTNPLNTQSTANGNDERLLRSAAPLPALFSQPLVIPPVIKPVRTDQDTDYYAITAKVAQATILPGMQTTIWGYNGIFPGPTFEARRGRKVVVHTRNELPAPIVTHLHGGHTPPESDGYPTDLLLPAAGWQAPSHAPGANHHQPMQGGQITQTERDYVYPHDQRAAMLWYHDHRMDFTAPQVWRGLAGLHIVRDDEEAALPLPRDERELPLLITDRAFAADGSMPYPSSDPTGMQMGVDSTYHNGVLGDVILVNGVPWPFVEVSAARYRLRIVNASNARRYDLQLDPPPPEGSPFTQIGSDGGLLAAPQELKRVYMTPAERFDLIVDFGRYPVGTNVVLTNRLGDGNTTQIMQFRVVRQAKDESAIPATLAQVERLDPAQAVRTRTFDFNQAQVDGQAVYRVNDRLFDQQFIAADPALGDTEIWTLRSTTHHPIHLHLVNFQVLARAGGLEPEDAGWKDTVRLTPRNDVQIITRFTGYRGKYVFHCHNLEHEDMAMMANFTVR